jgi:hypothetical protein
MGVVVEFPLQRRFAEYPENTLAALRGRLRALDNLRLHLGISRDAYLDERVRLLRLQAAALEAM